MQKAFKLLGFVVLAATTALAGPVLTPLPNGSIAGAPGATIGWGYSLLNDDPLLWYLPSSISLPIFSIGTPVSIFDYPVVAPLSTVTQAYTGTVGLLQLIFPAGATPGSFNSGSVVLSGDYWDSNPFTNPNAVIVAAAPNVTASITATVGAASIPEPSTATLMAGCGVLALFWFALSRGVPRKRMGRGAEG